MIKAVETDNIPYAVLKSTDINRESGDKVRNATLCKIWNVRLY